jgi:hypothetical protein
MPPPCGPQARNRALLSPVVAFGIETEGDERKLSYATIAGRSFPACRSAWPEQVQHPPSWRAALAFKLQAFPQMISPRRRMAKRFATSREMTPSDVLVELRGT